MSSLASAGPTAGGRNPVDVVPDARLLAALPLLPVLDAPEGVALPLSAFGPDVG